MSTEISVVSVPYNLAGDETQRPDYLKTLAIQHMFTQAPGGIGEAIQQGLLHGPAMKLRSFYRWASIPGNYDQIGMPTGSIRNTTQPSIGDIEPFIPYLEDEVVEATSVSLGQGDARFWAERWILDNRPEDFALDWSYQIDPAGEFITIIFPEGTDTPLVEVIPAITPSFSSSAWYVYASYILTSPGEVIEPEIVLDPETGEPIDPQPEPEPPEDVVTERRFIYAAGSGEPTLDALVEDAVNYGEFFPFIPIRLNDQFLSGSHFPDAYAQTKAAYKRALNGARIEDLVARINENPDVGDIDHAYVVLAVSLNVIEKQCRKYLYQFFDRLRVIQQEGPTGFDAWVGRGYTNTPLNTFTVQGSTSISNSYNIQIGWRYITERTGAGLGKVGAKVGEFWFEKNGTVDGHEDLRLFWQETAEQHRYLSLVGAYHQNFVYGAHAVTINAFEAIDNPEESGFLVPLHYDIWREAGLVVTSQMATACVFIVFNCFEVYEHEAQWWESWWFKILLVVAIAVVSVMFTGGAGLGLLGANLTLGTTLGFTGLTAAIVGAAVNGLAAMILVSLIEPLVKQVAGPYAPIVMAVLMFAIGQAAGSLQSAGTLSINWTDLLKVDNLLAMTNAIGQSVSDQINMDTLGTQQSSLDYLDKANAEIKKIQQAFYEEFGYGNATIDPLAFTDAARRGPINESSSTFLTRTLLTGSEIAEMSRQLLYEFPTYSLKLPDAFT